MRGAVNRGLPPAATIGRPPFGGLSRRSRRTDWLNEGMSYSIHARVVVRRACAWHVVESSGRPPFGGLSQRRRRTDWLNEGRSYSNRAVGFFRCYGTHESDIRVQWVTIGRPPFGGLFRRVRRVDCVVGGLPYLVDRSAQYEPAEGGRPLVAPCKRSAERSDAWSAAWGNEPHQFREPAERRANERCPSRATNPMGASNGGSFHWARGIFIIEHRA